MPKNDVDIVWVQEQFRGVRARKVVGEAVLKLLDAWEELEVAAEDVSEVVRTFAELAQGHSLLPEESEEVWVEARQGFVRVGDIIRIRHDAYDGESGKIHNGRIGRVVGVRGDIIMRSTDDKHPFIDGAHYPAAKVEKRVQ